MGDETDTTTDAQVARETEETIRRMMVARKLVVSADIVDLQVPQVLMQFTLQRTQVVHLVSLETAEAFAQDILTKIAAIRKARDSVLKVPGLKVVEDQIEVPE